jgi:hypothetical protein
VRQYARRNPFPHWDRQHATLLTPRATPRTDHSLPDCRCSTPPWEPCEHRDTTKARLTVQVPKDAAKRSGRYLRWVASLPCAHCGRDGPSQAAHSDEGKGMGIKAGDNLTYPLCADGMGRQGCHSLIGMSGKFSRERRRNLESLYVGQTAAAALLAGTWPEEWL